MDESSLLIGEEEAKKARRLRVLPFLLFLPFLLPLCVHSKDVHILSVPLR
jgi:hypothetical protein